MRKLYNKGNDHKVNVDNMLNYMSLQLTFLYSYIWHQFSLQIVIGYVASKLV